MKQNPTNEELRINAINETLKETPHLTSNLEKFFYKVASRFIQNKLYAFPKLCIEARRVNYLKQKELEAVGNPRGWSPSKDFKFDYIIPTELYMFMVNMVYRNFWSEENEKVWRSFMKAIMRGDDPMTLLKKVKVYYGAVAAQIV